MKTFFFLLLALILSFGLNYSQTKLQNQTEDFTQVNYNEPFIKNQVLGPNDPKYLSLQNQVSSIRAIYPLKLLNGNLAVFYFSSVSAQRLNVALSSDDGVNWHSTIPIQPYNYTQTTQQISAIQTNSGRVICVAAPSANNLAGRFLLFYSDNSGTTWTGPLNVGAGIIGTNGKNFDLSLNQNGDLIISYQNISNEYYFRRSTDNGLNWSDEIPVQANTTDAFGKVVELNSSQLGFIYSDVENSIYRIRIKTSTNNGTNWSNPQTIYSDTAKINSMKVVKTADNKIHIVFENEIRKTFVTHFSTQVNYTLKDIYTIQSTNNGTNWSTVSSFTKYKGRDELVNVGNSNDKPYVIFNSSRFDSTETNLKFWYGQVGIVNDNNAPPIMISYQHSSPQVNVPIIFNAVLLNTSPITQAKLNLIRNGIQISPLQIYDDGLHNDGLANDNVWGNTLGSFNNLIQIIYRIQVDDAAGNFLSFPGGRIELLNYEKTLHLFDINRFKVPISNDGVIADVTINGQSGGRYDEGSIVFSGGFFLSGYRNNQLWANGIATATRINDYLPGIFDTVSTQIDNNFFIVDVNDPPFGTRWQNWVNAVNLGADFYDGNGDGIYNPIDLNGNGQWDPNEDRPGLVGNQTTFFVYSDKVPSVFRIFNVNPLGIEIRQTTYAFMNTEYSLNNSVFVKYDILNKSGSDLDSVIFSVWADADIGYNYFEDFAGSDTLNQAIYTYKTAADPTYGSNPPSFFHSLLQGPIVYIPGETFIDLNNNGIFDPGVDTPIDTAYNIRGQVLGIDTLPGAKNQKISSSMHTIKSHIFLGDPSTVSEIRNVQIGRTSKTGELIDPCTWPFGTVIGVNCNQVNPKFMYSGDPETNFGWLNSIGVDQRTFLNVGPFNLKNNKSNKIVVAYVGSRGSNPKNSVTIGKQNLNSIREAYWKNFPVIVSVKDDKNSLPDKFELYQNYPNPFNPGTTISWQLPVSGRVTIKLFDILGREIETIVDGYYEAGKHSTFYILNSTLPSGVYFYRLQAGDYIETKKMVLVR